MTGSPKRLAARVAFLMLALASISQAATYYVSPNGSSGNDGSQAAPWRQIRDALPHLAPGDVVLVADGSYLGFTMSDVVGTAGLPITIQATGINAIVTTTTDRSDNRDTIFISFCSYVVIDGLTAFNANRAAVRVDQSDHVTVRNGVFGNNTTWGIFTDFSDYLVIEGNECYGTVQQHGVYVSNSCVGPVVRGNVSHDNRACGLHFNGDLSQGGTGLITGALVEKNVIFNNGVGGGAGINMDGVRSSTIRNNLLFNNHATGIALFQIDGALGPSGNEVSFNTIDMAADARWAVLISRSDPKAGKNQLRNNILNNRNAAHGGLNFATQTDVKYTDSDYNIMDKVTPNDGGTVYTLVQWKKKNRQTETHSLSAKNGSLFVNPAAGDYHLLDSAPALGAGISLASVVDDLEGTPRPAQAPDIGAYERP